jgi:hypothetical protein
MKKNKSIKIQRISKKDRKERELKRKAELWAEGKYSISKGEVK